MGALSWYQDKHDAYLEVWGPETFAAPHDWRTRAQRLTNEDCPGVSLVVPHPHDILLSKLERWETNDRAHAGLILTALPLTALAATRLADRCPHRRGEIQEPERRLRFEAHFGELVALLP